MKYTQKVTIDCKSVNSLCSSDQKLMKLIHLIGDLELKSDDNYFESLATSIIGQQLSSKAAATIRNRVQILCGGELTPDSIKSVSQDELRTAGLSRAKIEYIHDLSEKVNIGQLNFDNICDLENEEIIKKLTEIKGIGKWTAEMFLIFALGRTDVMSYADAGLQRAAKWLHDLPNVPKFNYLQQVEHLWSPYQSIASLYLWEAIDRGFVDSGKSLDDLVKPNE